MALQISAGIRDQRKTGGMRLGKSIERERSNGKDDLLLRFRREAVALHARTKLDLDIAHAFFAAFEAKGTPQFFRPAAAEPSGNHCHAQQLLLEERHS